MKRIGKRGKAVEGEKEVEGKEKGCREGMKRWRRRRGKAKGEADKERGGGGGG